MFTQILFIILVLLTLGFVEPHASPLPPLTAFLLGLVWWAGAYGLIALQNRYLRRLAKRSTLYLLANIELLAVTFCTHHLFAFYRLYWMGSHTLITVVGLAFFFIGLSIHFLTTRKGIAKQQIRLFLPLCLPFIMLDLALDIESRLHLSDATTWIITLVLLGLIIIFLPACIQKLWGCKPLEKNELTERLEALCIRARFTHGGLKEWRAMKNHVTAAIIGVVRPFRYVMFTPKLLQTLPADQIEAILAHEIGHSRHKHLLLFPFILMGMVVAMSLYLAVYHEIPLQGTAGLLALFLPCVAIVALYFRFVFGFFSRLFERQADLFVFRVGIPPSHMIGALDALARLNGNIHKKPNWHHFSIEKRIAFLERVTKDPASIDKHHRRTKTALLTYGGILAIGIAFLLILM